MKTIFKKLASICLAAGMILNAGAYAQVLRSSSTSFDDFTEVRQESLLSCEFGNMPEAGSEYGDMYTWTPETGVFGKSDSDTSFHFSSELDAASLPSANTNPYLQFNIRDNGYEKGQVAHISFNLARSGGSTNMYVQVRPNTADGESKWFSLQSALSLRTWIENGDVILINDQQHSDNLEYGRWYKIDLVYYPLYDTVVDGASGEYTVMDMYIDGEKILDKFVMDADGYMDGYQTMTGISFIRFAFDPRSADGVYPKTDIYLDDIKYELLDEDPTIADSSEYIQSSVFEIDYANNTVPHVYLYTPASMLLDGLTLLDGCTAEVVDADGYTVDGSADLETGMMLVVSKQDDEAKTYTINVHDTAVDVDFDDWDNKFYYGGPNNDYNGYSFAGPTLSDDVLPSEVAYMETVSEPGRGNVLHTHSESDYSTAGYSHMNLIKNETPARDEIGSKFIMEYSAKIGENSSTGLQCKYYNKSGSEIFSNPIYFSNGTIKVFDTIIGTYVNNRWYDIKAYCDSTTGEVVAYINGIEAYRGTDSSVGNFNYFSNIRLIQHYCVENVTEDTWIDNIKIYGASGLTDSFLATMDNTLSSDRYFVDGEYINGYYGLTAGELVSYAVVSEGASVEVFEEDEITPVDDDAPAQKGMIVRVTSKGGSSYKNYILDIERYNVSRVDYTVNGKNTNQKFAPGELKVNVSVTNYAEESMNVTPIIAQYRDGVLEKLSFETVSAEGRGTVSEVAAEMEVTETEGTTIKIMVFDSMNEMNSIAESIELQPFSSEQIESVEVYYPNYTTKAITFSFDDCIIQDARIAEIFNDAGLKATFNLKTDNFTELSEAGQQDVYERYQGHEVANHTRTHPRMYLTEDTLIDGITYSPLTLEECEEDIYRGMEDIEGLFGVTPEGLVWPYTRPSARSDYDELIEYIRSLGVKYIRPIDTTGNFDLPDDWYNWKPTCHTDSIKYYIDNFLSLDTNGELKLFYIWGHGFELDETYDPSNTSKFRWSDLEALAERLKDRDDVWKATNIEIYDYIEAARGLEIDYENNIITNPSDVDVYVQINGINSVIPANGTGAL